MILSWLKTLDRFPLGIFLSLIITVHATGQTVPFPENPPYNDLSYYGYEDVGQNWDTSPYLPFIYQGTALRLLPPNGVSYDQQTNTWVNSNPGQEYPMLVYSMGAGGRGTDNTIQLKGKNDIGHRLRDAVQDDEFPGFVMFWQTENQELSSGKFASIVNKLLNEIPMIDQNGIHISGRSRGATQTWQFLRDRPELIASSLAISGASGTFFNSNSIHVPVRHVQGGRDLNPTPQESQDIVDQYIAAGGDLEYFLYEDLGHGAWGRMYNRSDFYTWFLEQKKYQPLVFYGFTEVCPGDPVNIKLGYTAGFSNYQWMKDGVIISGANNHEYTVTSFGSYQGRFARGSEWTPWSDPIEISLKEPTVTPPIETEDFVSTVLPSLDGNTTISLQLPEGYADYQWKQVGSNGIIGTDRVLSNAGPGEYIAQVQEFGGCTSSFGNPFTIANADGPNGPDAPTNLLVKTLSKTSLELLWDQNPTPSNEETGFEIYRGATETSPLQLIHITGNDASSFIDEGLEPNTAYWYKIRAINSTAASAASALVGGTTEVDEQAPTSPLNLMISDLGDSYATISWDEASDNVGVENYEIYVDGLKSYVTTETSFFIPALSTGQVYQVAVKAKDVAGNFSAESNNVFVIPGIYPEAHFGFNGSFDEENGKPVNATPQNGIAMSDVEVQQGSHALVLDGSNDYVDLSGGNDLFVNEFTSRSVTFWLKANSTTGNQVLYDEGGSTNGFALRLLNNQLQFAVRDGNNQVTLSIPYTSTNWSHVAAIFHQGAIRLYVDGTEVATNNSVGYNEVSRHTDSSGFGATSGGNNAFNDPGGSFGGYLDELYVLSTNLSAAGIADIIDGTSVELTIPNAPTDLLATPVSYDQIDLDWTDNSTDESEFQIFRATDIAGPFNAIAKVAADVTSFSDQGLASATTYYYAIVAIGESGNSVAEGQETSTATAHLQFNNNLEDISSNAINSVLRNGASFTDLNKVEGSHSLSLAGNNDYVDVDTGNEFIHDAFDQRSFAMWLYTDNTSGIQDIFDEGGSTNGIGLRINNGAVEAGVQNAHDQYAISAPIANSTWTHVAVVFDNGELRLFIDGSELASNLSIPYNIVDNHGNDAGLGASNGSNAFDQVNNNYNGLIDDFRIYQVAINLVDLEDIMDVSNGSSATTFELPALPQAPTGLLISNTTSTTVTINWDDLGSNESGYEVYKSLDNPTSLVLTETLGPDQTSYTFQGLFPHSQYYFAVKTLNIAGASEASEIDVATENTTPFVEQIDDVLMRYDESIQMVLVAEDPDGANEFIAFNAINFPDFATLDDYGDETAELIIAPTSTDAGYYPNLEVEVTDAFGGTLTLSFDLTVNSNHTPEISGLSAVALRESEVATLTLTGSDTDGDDLSWLFENLPAFVDTTKTGNDLTLTFAPGLLDAGSYAIDVTLDDGNLGTASGTINLTVEDYDPNYEVYVNFGASGSDASSPWNNITGDGSAGTTGTDLPNHLGEATPIDVTVNTSFSGSSSSGGNAPGIYPDAVMLSYFWTNSVPEELVISGLDPTYRYNLEFMASRNSNNDRTTVFTSNGQSSSVDATQNTSNTARLERLQPDANGELLVTVTLGGNASYGYLNSMVIESRYDDGSSPAAPTDVVATLNGSNHVNLTWTDIAFNEDGYKVYRTIAGESEVELAQLGAEATTYLDETALGHTTYSYRIEAYNGNGSGSTVASDVTTNNNEPTFDSELEQTALINTTTDINLLTDDFDGDRVEVTANNLPVFATFDTATDVLSITPAITDIGDYTIALTVEDYDNNDNLLSSTSYDLLLSVSDKEEEVIYINFSVEGTASSPWNSTDTYPSSGKDFLNLVNEDNVATTVDMSLIDGWSGGNSQGVNTGDDSALYPDDVTSTYYAHNSTTSKRIRFTDLDPSKLYDFVLFASRAGITEDRETVYTIGSKSVTLNARDNASEVVRINAVSPTGSGEIELSVARASGSSWAYVNALELRYYEPSSIPGMPLDLTATAGSKSSIDISWSDNSNNETGFELYTSATASGPFTLLSTTAADVESYQHTGLSTGSTHYYKLRAINASGESPYTEVVGSATLRRAIYINVGGAGAVAAAPWNNTNNLPSIGNEYLNLLDDEGINSGVDMSIIANDMETTFSGVGNGGAITGDDSGVFPDAVMQSYYYIEQVEIASFKFANLNLNRRYDFEFFASRTVDKRGTDFIINGTAVSLDAYNNTTNTVTISGVLPDNNGEIVLDMTSMPGATLGHVNAVVIYESDVVGGSSSREQFTDTSALGNSNEILSFNIFPNPVEGSEINIYSERQINKVYIIDNTGRLVDEPEMNLVNNISRLMLNESRVKSGSYFMRILFEDGSSTIKRIIKK